MTGLVWAQTVCKGYQKAKMVGRVKIKNDTIHCCVMIRKIRCKMNKR